MLLSYKNKDLLECGTDEAGRGCLAGPVTAAAVILPKDFTHPLLNDSKKLTSAQRALLRPVIEENAIAYKVVHLGLESIAKLNILGASIKAMQQAILGLQPLPEYVLVDGNRFSKNFEIPFECVVKGDGKYLNIAAASILAKTYRDELMQDLDQKFPEYGWKKNKGYPTKAHREAIVSHGISIHHRQGFKLLPTQKTLF